MKAYAGVIIRKTESMVSDIRAYEENILYAINDIITHFPLLASDIQQEGKRILIIFGSSQGLCGAFNERLVDILSDTYNDNDNLFVIGKRLKSVIELRHISYDDYNDSIVSIDGVEQALKETLSQILNVYKKKDYYGMDFIFTTITGKRPVISVERILPPDIDRVRTLTPSGSPPLTYLEPAYIFDMVLEEFLYISLYRCFIESLRSENWYRLRSMEGASEAIKRRITDLVSQQKFVRQEEITEEMLEILGSGMFYGNRQSDSP